MRFFVGGYAAGMDGDAEGIGVLHAGEPDSPWASGALALRGTAVSASGSPSWLAAHPTLDVVYAAVEGEGTVQAYRRTGEERLARLGPPRAAGEAVCHVAVSPDGRYLLASCWGDGRVVRMPLDAAGVPSAPSIAPAATDPYARRDAESRASVSTDPAATDREAIPAEPPSATDPDGILSFGRESGARMSGKSPELAAAAAALRSAAGDEYAHLVPDYDLEASSEAPVVASGDRVSRAHEAIFLPGGLVATTDLGFDLVRIWRPSERGLRLAQEIALPLGSGPRHGVWHPSGHLYIVTELSCEVFVLAPDRTGRWRVVSGVPLIGVLPGDTGAELAANRDGTTLYAGVRGSDTIGVLAVRGGGETLQQAALAEVGTRGPRHHVIERDTLLVAGQLGDEVVSLPLDPRTGIPGRVQYRTPAPSPTHLLAFA